MAIIDFKKLLNNSTACGEWDSVGFEDLQFEVQGDEIWVQGSVKCSACQRRDNCAIYETEEFPGMFKSVVKIKIVESCIPAPFNCRNCEQNCSERM